MARLQVSVADAHLGATVAVVADRGAVAIITSDHEDMAAVTDPGPVIVTT